MILLNKFRILKYFARDVSKEYYGSEIAKSLNLNQKTVSNHLNELEQEEILNKRNVGKNLMFSFNKEYLKEILLMIESYKKIEFLKHNIKIDEVMKKLDITDPALIFGSYAKGLQKKDSDLDILIIGKADEKKAKDISALYGIKISVKAYGFEEFRKHVKGDEVLIREMIKDHIILNGIEFFIREFYS